jgi:hypothetical protein
MSETASGPDIVRHWAREIVTGHVSPIDGARCIVQEGPEELDAGGELMVFAGLIGEWEEDESRRADCEARIMDEAALLLADTA